ncbi:MAG: NADH-quinone oxidoreductase subunit L [Dehalococcoidia bacterium]
MPDYGYWLIFFLPLAVFLINPLILRPLGKERFARYAGYLTILAIGGSFVLSVWALISVAGAGKEELPIVINTEWFTIGDFTLVISLLIDKLTTVMLIVVTLVSLMVQIYSQGYMHGDTGYMRYYTCMSLFTASMLGLVLSGNILFTYVFWEMVGLCSYLLIGFWFHKPSAAAAAKKAFIVTRFGDFGFLLAILAIYFNVGTLQIAEIPHAIHVAFLTGALSGTVINWIIIGIFSGAVGKSAQFPLHTWLPDAMEGPTPVSALIHAATMVAAGVFLVARLFPLFTLPEVTPAIMVVAVIGGFTAIFAASMGMVMNDVKRVLAYSTISQLGYMMLGLGAVGVAVSAGAVPREEGLALGVAVGIFHLFTHAFFKSMLFLASGSVSHATGTFDMRLMGGLKKHQPWTFVIFLIGALSLAGIWPLAGFWSKDGILAEALHHTPLLFWLGLITVFLTAFYMFRALFMTFGGEYRGGDAAHGEDVSHPHESPTVMIGPMVLLAILSVAAGWFGISSFLGGHGVAFMGEGVHGFFGVFAHPGLPLYSLLVGLAGIFAAYAIYSARWVPSESIGQAMPSLYTMLSRKYWMDDLYEIIIVRTLLVNGIFRVCHWFDDYIVDGIVNGLASLTRLTGRGLRHAQVGQLQEYGMAIAFGVIVILAIVLIGFY